MTAEDSAGQAGNEPSPANGRHREIMVDVQIRHPTNTNMSSPWTLVLSFIVGTFAGSFFYTLSLRYASGEMKRSPWRALVSRSVCPACNNPISPVFLAPIIGYLLALGRCRSCGASISLRYPIAESAFGAMAALFAWKLGITVHSANLYLLACIALCIAVVDASTLSIPDSLVIAFAVLSVYPIILSGDITNHVFGILLMAAIFGLVLLILPGSFGFGDVKFAAAIGLFAGLEMSLVVLELSLVSGAIVGIIYAIVTRRGLRAKIPFAPFLTTGLLITMLWGHEILLIYLRFVF